ncbi:hypothetical protein RHSIM_Rhsim01G0094600 [Rhododendron simsii]|uniref:Uncharacterized protein n=1 Tax=Rhododendron simsii TaxID=118357 RepID=A0A834LW42_RHOSS|nr:hypothetical protein RHSIM_Rhsim01G0094600 [Rhododendron simsii]
MGRTKGCFFMLNGRIWWRRKIEEKRCQARKGFDIGDIPYNNRASGVPVRPIDLDKVPESLVMIEKFSSFTIKEFNKSKVNDIACPGSSPLNFRAKVYQCKGYGRDSTVGEAFGALTFKLVTLRF